jgi:hypothetical protein
MQWLDRTSERIETQRNSSGAGKASSSTQGCPAEDRSRATARLSIGTTPISDGASRRSHGKDSTNMDNQSSKSTRKLTPNEVKGIARRRAMKLREKRLAGECSLKEFQRIVSGF